MGWEYIAPFRGEGVLFRIDRDLGVEVNFHLKLKFKSFSFKLKHQQDAHVEGWGVIGQLPTLNFSGRDVGGGRQLPNVTQTLNPTLLFLGGGGVVVPRHLPYIVVTSTDMAASCKAVELRINP